MSCDCSGPACELDADAAATKIQKVYKSYRTRRNLADCAVLSEELWWQALDLRALKRSLVSLFKVRKDLSKDEMVKKLGLQIWLENIDPRHRYGDNLQLYYDVWSAEKSNKPFFYWLDVGDGKEVNLETCPRIVLQSQCINYLGPHENSEENSTLLSNTRSLDIEANYCNDGVDLSRKVTLERMFVITNFILELPSSVFDQLSSVRKPQYALIGMLTSVIAMLICIIELFYKVGKERVEWRWRRRNTRNIILPWFYYSSPSYERRFGSLYDIVGLVCAICQCIVTIINYTFIYRHTDNPIKISVWPIIFAFGLLCSKFMEKRDMRSAA